MAQQNEIYVNTGITDNRYNVDLLGETWFFKAEENQHIPIDEYNWNADIARAEYMDIFPVRCQPNCFPRSIR